MGLALGRGRGRPGWTERVTRCVAGGYGLAVGLAPVLPPYCPPAGRKAAESGRWLRVLSLLPAPSPFGPQARASPADSLRWLRGALLLPGQLPACFPSPPVYANRRMRFTRLLRLLLTRNVWEVYQRSRSEMRSDAYELRAVSRLNPTAEESNPNQWFRTRIYAVARVDAQPPHGPGSDLRPSSGMNPHTRVFPGPSRGETTLMPEPHPALHRSPLSTYVQVGSAPTRNPAPRTSETAVRL